MSKRHPGVEARHQLHKRATTGLPVAQPVGSSAPPYSNDPRAPSVTSVSTASTPPIAWLPQIVLFEPRSSSILLMPAGSSVPKSNPPAGDAVSATRMPSITTSSCSASAPRTRSPVNEPTPPFRDSVTPGSRSAIRAISAPCTRPISSRPTIETGCPVAVMRARSPLATTVMIVSRTASSMTSDRASSGSSTPWHNPGEDQNKRIDNSCLRIVPPATTQGRSWREARPFGRSLALAVGAPRPRPNDASAGRSPGSRIVATRPPSRHLLQGEQWPVGAHSPVTVAGAARDLHPLPSSLPASWKNP
jgi:hypothetical protein